MAPSRPGTSPHSTARRDHSRYVSVGPATGVRCAVSCPPERAGFVAAGAFAHGAHLGAWRCSRCSDRTATALSTRSPGCPAFPAPRPKRPTWFWIDCRSLMSDREIDNPANSSSTLGGPLRWRALWRPGLVWLNFAARKHARARPGLHREGGLRLKRGKFAMPICASGGLPRRGPERLRQTAVSRWFNA